MSNLFIEEGQEHLNDTSESLSRMNFPEYSSLNSINMYHEEVKHIPMLSKEEQDNLFLQVKEIKEMINQARIALSHPKEDEQQLKLKKQIVTLQAKLQKIKVKIVEQNLRLVLKYTENYRNNSNIYLDLVQECNLALFEAIEGYDLEKGSFANYTYYKIQKSIQNYLIKLKNVKISSGTTELLSKVDKAIHILSLTHKEVSDEDIIRYINTHYVQTGNLTIKKVKYLRDLLKLRVESIDAPVKDSEGLTYADIISDTIYDTPEKAVIKISRREQLNKILSQLQERQAYVVKQHYGYTDGRHDTMPKEQKEIGRQLGITGSRVSSIEQKAISKMRKLGQLNLKELYNE